MMTSKQRVLAALSNKQPDRVPVVESIDEPILIKLAHILGIDLPADDHPFRQMELNCRIVEALNLDSVDSYTLMGLKPADQNRLQDRFGCVFMPSEHGLPIVIDGPIKTASDLESYDMPSRLSSEDIGHTRYGIERMGAEKASMLWCQDPFKLSWLLRGGMQHLLLDYAMDPDMVHALARTSTDYNFAVLEMAAEAGVDVVALEGDLAGEETTIMSPQHYREYIKPYQAEIVACAHRLGLKIFKHSDGNMWPILEDHIEVGFDGFHPIQPDCMDIAEVKAKSGGRWCLIGNIDCRDLLCSDTPQAVAATVAQTIRVAGPGGGYMVMSSNSIHPGVDPDNYIAMVKAAHEHGVYPL